MMMMGLHFMDEVPFHTVYIHALVRDEQGQKMSKSKGNVLDPLDLIDQYSADSLRFTLTAMAAQGRDIKLSTGRIEGYRNFITKIWNAARYAEMNECRPDPSFDPSSCKLTVNQWIVGAAADAEVKISSALDDYRFNDAANAVYQFAWHSYCDWYLEFTKPILAGDNSAAIAETRAATAWALEQILLLLHPISPFVTEELWEKLAPAEGRAGPLITAAWPSIPQYQAMKEASDEMGWIILLISEIRAVRSEMNVPAGAKIPLLVQGESEVTRLRLDRHRDLVQRLARIETIASVEGELPKGGVQVVLDEATFFLPVGDVIDIVQENDRLEREIGKIRDEIATVRKKLGNEKFTSRAPAEVVQENRVRLAGFELSERKLIEALTRLTAL
jgi:valyl-tRNA synthetase